MIRLSLMYQWYNATSLLETQLLVILSHLCMSHKWKNMHAQNNTYKCCLMVKPLAFVVCFFFSHGGHSS